MKNSGAERAAAAAAAPAAAPAKARAIPSKPDDGATDLTTDLVLVAAACLASVVRSNVTGIDQCTELARALENFELADRAFMREHGDKYRRIAEERSA